MGRVGKVVALHDETPTARCPVCEQVLLRLVNARQRVFLDLRGMRYLSLYT